MAYTMENVSSGLGNARQSLLDTVAGYRAQRDTQAADDYRQQYREYLRQKKAMEAEKHKQDTDWTGLGSIGAGVGGLLGGPAGALAGGALGGGLGMVKGAAHRMKEGQNPFAAVGRTVFDMDNLTDPSMMQKIMTPAAMTMMGSQISGGKGGLLGEFNWDWLGGPKGGNLTGFNNLGIGGAVNLPY